MYKIYGKNKPYIFLGEKIIKMSTRNRTDERGNYITIQINFIDGSMLAGRVNRGDKNLHISKKTTYDRNKFIFIINGSKLVEICNNNTWL